MNTDEYEYPPGMREATTEFADGLFDDDPESDEPKNRIMTVTNQQVKTWTPTEFWHAYRDAVYHVEIGKQQEHECSNAFLAGLHAGFEFQMLASIRLEEEEAVKAITRFRDLLQVMALTQNPTGEQ